MQPALDLKERRLVVCLGPGGVGKTTVSASIALHAATRGRTVDVMTIDPAPRLIDALGLEGDAAEPREVELVGVDKACLGRLRALRLDPKRTFDALVDRYASSPAAREAILGGRIYQNLSSALAGVADYMAMEQLLALHNEGTADLIVLDTPPSREAIDFLDAPARMLELMRSRALSLLGASRALVRGPFGLLDSAARAVLGLFDRFSGLHLLADVQEFVRNFDGMYEGFAARATEAAALLRNPTTMIVLVTTAEQARIAQACDFIQVLDERGLNVGTVVVNRMMPSLPDVESVAQVALPAALKHKLEQCADDYHALKQREQLAIKELRASLPPITRLLAGSDCGQEPRSLSDLLAIAKSFRQA